MFGPDSGELGVALDALCACYVAVTIELRNRSRADAVLSEVICDHLVIRGWDEATLPHTDELFLLPLSSVARVTIW